MRRDYQGQRRPQTQRLASALRGYPPPVGRSVRVTWLAIVWPTLLALTVAGGFLLPVEPGRLSWVCACVLLLFAFIGRSGPDSRRQEPQVLDEEPVDDAVWLRERARRTELRNSQE